MLLMGHGQKESFSVFSEGEKRSSMLMNIIVGKTRASLKTKEDFKLVMKELPNDKNVLYGCS